jgi:hypothetical protein
MIWYDIMMYNIQFTCIYIYTYIHNIPSINHWFHVPHSMLGRKAMGWTVHPHIHHAISGAKSPTIWSFKPKTLPFDLSDPIGLLRAASLRLRAHPEQSWFQQNSYMNQIRTSNFGFGIGDLRRLSQSCVFLDYDAIQHFVTAMAWSQGSPSLGRDAWADSRWRVGRHDRLGVQSTRLSASEVP